MLIIPVFAAPSSIDYPARALINGVVMTLYTKEEPLLWSTQGHPIMAIWPFHKV